MHSAVDKLRVALVVLEYIGDLHPTKLVSHQADRTDCDVLRVDCLSPLLRKLKKQFKTLDSQHITVCLICHRLSQMTRQPQADALYLSYCFLILPSIGKNYSMVCLCVQLAARESSVGKMWDAGIVKPANSLIRHCVNADVH